MFEFAVLRFDLVAFLGFLLEVFAFLKRHLFGVFVRFYTHRVGFASSSLGIVLQPMPNDQKLMLLPVQRLTDIMSTVYIQERKKTTLYDVPLL